MAASTTASDQCLRQEFKPQTDLGIGTLASPEAFDNLLGVNSNELEEFHSASHEPVGIFGAEASNTAVISRFSTTWGVNQNGHCTSRHSWEWIVCEKMPSSWAKWGLGVGLLVYSTPTLLNNWLNDVAILAGNGFNPWTRARHMRNSAQYGTRKVKAQDQLRF
ncbi:hypothetical protein HJFPF1_04442 [Paramyrothecium foliicola]|nr:hypothetical protein HJFPF1_04442 [Paramyrothecium foliicola]